MSVIVENVSRKYGSLPALINISFEIRSGEVLGFIGPNGAGKSTMMKIICGIMSPDEGSVKVNGFDVINDSINVKKIIGYLPENNPLYNDLYIKEYLKYISGIYNPWKKPEARINEIIGLIGLKDEINKKIGQLSKGFRQRVGLAQAILHDPDVLILDEPTSGLDPNQITDIRSLISELGKEKTVMLSTHIIQEVEAICDRVLIINKGKIVADDKAQNMQLYGKNNSCTILIEFSESFDKNKLLKITGVEKIRPVSKKSWLIQTTNNKDLRPEIFKFAVDNNLTVLSLQRKDKSLEDVFRELTK